MTSKFVRILVATVFGLSLSALAQTAPATNAASQAAVPNAPSAASAVPAATGTRVGTINIEGAIFSSNEGRRDLDALSKKLEPKQTELKGMSEEIDGLKKQLSTQGDKMNDDAKNALVRQIESKQKVFERSMQDAREEAQGQQGEIMQRVLGKMAPVIVKYASENGFGIIIDTSQPWPQGPVVWYGQSVDITLPVVEAYNVKSGVPAPPPTAAGGAKPAGGAARPATPPAAKPATPPATKPPATTPPKQ
ncbi:MAG: OmpH family outer membrane protein [Acidobacteriales bacterium]|nr:OmpH family outer membrane protein [Candidatus Koribacter versatilis]MBI3644983.1 OmpH family outer membrane protein [Terriglobales bacterium]